MSVAITLEVLAAAYGDAIRAECAAGEAQSDRLIGSIPVVGGPGPIVAGAGFVWMSNLEEDSISEIAPASQAVVRSIPLGMQVSGLAPYGRSIFAVGTRPTDAYVTVKRIDPTPSRSHRPRGASVRLLGW